MCEGGGGKVASEKVNQDLSCATQEKHFPLPPHSVPFSPFPLDDQRVHLNKSNCEAYDNNVACMIERFCSLLRAYIFVLQRKK